MTGDFEIDDVIDRHGKAIAKKTAPPKVFTWVQCLILYAIIGVIACACVYGLFKDTGRPADTAIETYEKMARYHETAARVFRALAEERKKSEEASSKSSEEKR